MRLTSCFLGLSFVLSCNSAEDTRLPAAESGDDVPSDAPSNPREDAAAETDEPSATEIGETSSAVSTDSNDTGSAATNLSDPHNGSADAGTATDVTDTGGSANSEPLLDAGNPSGDASAPDPFPCPSDDAEPPSDGFNAVCDPSGEWGTETAVSISSSELDQLIAITPDELTISWYAATGAAGNYLLADRETPEADFGAPQAVYDVVVTALAADGLRVLGIAQDGSALLELERAQRGDAFSAANSETYDEVNSEAAAAGELFRSALLSADDLALYYSVQGTADSALLKVSTRDDVNTPWPAGTLVSSCELGGQGPLVRQPTGIAADGLTLFYYDAARGLARGAWRAAADEPFVYFVDLGQRRAVQANGECNRLYYSVVGETTQIVFAELR
jgi:hypothetical protein